MSRITVPMYVESVSSSTVVLEKRLNESQLPAGAGTGIAMITVVTTESTATPGFWGATGGCGFFDVIFVKRS